MLGHWQCVENHKTCLQSTADMILSRKKNASGGGEVLACRVLVPQEHVVDLFHRDNFKTLAAHKGARVDVTLVLKFGPTPIRGV